MALQLESADTLDMVNIEGIFTRGYEGYRYIVPMNLNGDQIIFNDIILF